MPKRYLWLAVTPDKYELPMVVADSSKELAKLLGVSHSSIRVRELRELSGRNTGYKVVKVKVDLKEEV